MAAISNIESILEKIKDKIGREEAVGFKAYLRLAIANFATADTSPRLHTSHHKYILTKLQLMARKIAKNGLKNVAITIHRTTMGVVSNI